MRMYSKVKNYSLFHSLFPEKIYFFESIHCKKGENMV